MKNNSYTNREGQEHLTDTCAPENVVYLTGDTHGRFDRIRSFCKKYEVESENTFIILGDVGLNYFGDTRDRCGKRMLFSGEEVKWLCYCH